MNLEELAKFKSEIKTGDLIQVEFEKGMLFRKKAIETGRVTEISDDGVEIDTIYKTTRGKGGLPVGFAYINYADLLDYRKVEEPKAQ